MFAKAKSTTDDTPMRRDEYETLLQDQLTELRPLQRRPAMMRPRFVTLKIVQNESTHKLGRVVKLTT
ncbi:MAG: hypothetical protein ABJQ34_03430 [Paracoccaceae bacterium]